MAKSLLSVGCLILIVAQICVRCNPMGQRGQVQELGTLKDLIKLLQDQLTDSEKKNVLQQFDGISGEDLEGNPATSLQTEENIVVVDPPSRYPADGAALSRLRDLSRTARSSNCFGSRLDRIGTWSGLGCNTMRWGNMKRIFRK